MLLTVAVGALLMPETKGRDLETIGDAFGLAKVDDMPVVRGLRSLASRAIRVGKRGIGWRRHDSDVNAPGIELESRQ